MLGPDEQFTILPFPETNPNVLMSSNHLSPAWPRLLHGHHHHRDGRSRSLAAAALLQLVRCVCVCSKALLENVSRSKNQVQINNRLIRGVSSLSLSVSGTLISNSPLKRPRLRLCSLCQTLWVTRAKPSLPESEERWPQCSLMISTRYVTLL